MNAGLALLSTAALGGCLIALSAFAGIKVEAERDFDLARYETYGWEKGVAAARPEVQSAIVGAVEARLERAGLRKVDPAEADLLVSTLALAEAEASSGAVVDTGYRATGDDIGVPIVDIGDFRKGTLELRLRDRAADRRVWSAVATSVFDERETRKAEERVDGIVEKMFRKLAGR